MSVPKIPVMDFTEIEAVTNFRKQSKLHFHNGKACETDHDHEPPVIQVQKKNTFKISG